MCGLAVQIRIQRNVLWDRKQQGAFNSHSSIINCCNIVSSEYIFIRDLEAMSLIIAPPLDTRMRLYTVW